MRFKTTITYGMPEKPNNYEWASTVDTESEADAVNDSIKEWIRHFPEAKYVGISIEEVK